MKLHIRQGRATLKKVTPRADGPGGKVRVKNKQTGKTTFVSPKTLEDHPDRYEGPGQKRLDKQKRREMARKEREKREKDKGEKDQPLTPEQRKDRVEELKQKRQERLTKEEEGREKSRVQKERRETWQTIENDHPELTPEQQAERKKLFFEKGIDSGGRSSRAIRWWLQHHGHDPDEGVSMDKPKEPRKLDRKTIQEHFKYGPKPTKKGTCGGQLKAVKVGNITICIDPNVYDVEGP